MVQCLVRAANSRGKVLLFTEHIAIDETQLKAKVANFENMDPDPTSKEDVVLPFDTVDPGKVVQATEVTEGTRILQARRRYSLLLRMNVDSDGAPKYFSVNFELPLPLMTMADKSASCTFNALVHSSVPLRDLFADDNLCYRFAMTDGDGAMAKGVRALAAKEDIVTLHSVCVIHKVARFTGLVANPREKDGFIPGLINVALSLSSGNHMRLFRDSLRQVIKRRLKRIEVAPLIRHQRRQGILLDVCIPPTSPNKVLRRSIISSLANGDWQPHDILEHRCSGCCKSQKDCERKFCGAFVSSVCSTAPPLFPRHRWTGCREALSWILLLESINRLFTETYLHWSTRLPGGARITPLLEAWRSGTLTPSWASTINAATMADNEEERGGDPEDAAHPTSTSRHEAAPCASADAVACDWAAKQAALAAQRNIALKLLTCDNIQGIHGKLFALRQTLEPLALQMDICFQQAGIRWDQEQELREGLRTKFPNLGLKTRSYRLSSAASGAFVAPVARRISELMLPGEWLPLHPCHRDHRLETTTAVMLSQAGACAASLDFQFNNWPIKLFGMVGGHLDAASVGREPQCRFGVWTAHFVEWANRNGGIDSADARTMIEHIDAKHILDNAGIEVGHANCRARSVRASVQTHQVTMTDLSASWMLSQTKKVSVSSRPSRATPGARAEKRKRHHKQKQKKTRTKKGGAWRAYVAQRTKGARGLQHLGVIAKEYWELDEKTRAELHTTGRAGIARRQAGLSAFGGTTREVERATKRRRREADAIATLHLGPLQPGMIEPVRETPAVSGYRSLEDAAASGNDVVALVAERDGPPLTGASQWDRIPSLGKALRAQRRQEILRQRIAHAVGIEHDSTLGEDLIAKFLRVFPEVKHRGSEFSAFRGSPDSTIGMLRWSPVDSLSRITAIISSARDTHASQLLMKQLEVSWALAHSTVQSQPTAPEVERAVPQHRKCHEAGMCICSPEGRAVDAFLQYINEAIKSTVKGKTKRHALKHGMYAAAFVAETEEQYRNRERCGDESQALALQPDVVWFHISKHILSPWVPTFHLCSAAPECMIPDARAASLPVKTTIYFTGEHKIGHLQVNEFSRDKHWSICLYEVFLCDEMVGVFQPDHLTIHAVDGRCTLTEVWNPFDDSSSEEGMHGMGYLMNQASNSSNSNTEMSSGGSDEDSTDETSNDSTDASSSTATSSPDKEDSEEPDESDRDSDDMLLSEIIPDRSSVHVEDAIELQGRIFYPSWNKFPSSDRSDGRVLRAD